MNLDSKLTIILFIIISFITILDFIVSYKIIRSFKKIAKEKKDNTYEISRMVIKEIKKKRFLLRRLIEAFPSIITKRNRKKLFKDK